MLLPPSYLLELKADAELRGERGGAGSKLGKLAIADAIRLYHARLGNRGERGANQIRERCCIDWGASAQSGS